MTAPASRLQRNNRIAAGLCLIIIGGLIALLQDDTPARTLSEGLEGVIQRAVAVGFVLLGGLLLILATKTARPSVTAASSRSARRNKLPLIVALTPPGLLLFAFAANMATSAAYDARLLELGSPLLAFANALRALSAVAALLGIGTILPALIGAFIIARTSSR